MNGLRGLSIFVSIVALTFGQQDLCERDSVSSPDDGNPAGPLVPCENLPEIFVECETVVDLRGNQTLKTKLNGYGCTRFGGNRYEEVEQGLVWCRVMPCIECRGNRTFMRPTPCIKYNGHYFVSTLLYSIFLGFVAVDRFCLGYTAIAVGKLMTLGGLGVWWIVDIFLLVTGSLTPADGSSWEPYY